MIRGANKTIQLPIGCMEIVFSTWLFITIFFSFKLDKMGPMKTNDMYVSATFPQAEEDEHRREKEKEKQMPEFDSIQLIGNR